MVAVRLALKFNIEPVKDDLCEPKASRERNMEVTATDDHWMITGRSLGDARGHRCGSDLAELPAASAKPPAQRRRTNDSSLKRGILPACARVGREPGLGGKRVEGRAR